MAGYKWGGTKYGQIWDALQIIRGVGPLHPPMDIDMDPQVFCKYNTISLIINRRTFSSNTSQGRKHG